MRCPASFQRGWANKLHSMSKTNGPCGCVEECKLLSLPNTRQQRRNLQTKNNYRRTDNSRTRIHNSKTRIYNSKTRTTHTHHAANNNMFSKAGENVGGFLCTVWTGLLTFDCFKYHYTGNSFFGNLLKSYRPHAIESTPVTNNTRTINQYGVNNCKLLKDDSERNGSDRSDGSDIV